MIKYLSLENLTKYLNERFGIIIDSKNSGPVKKYLNSHIQGLMGKDWEAELNKDSLQKLINEITITETYFFRDKIQINFLKENITERVNSSRVNQVKNLTFWSMGVSGGEEAYTLAILLAE